ncbi:MAG TPA: sigma 54-interacting transcriptional regulator [Gemmataceae bacterium]|nr:sigma 54-interacting transcriptional regulator [Gemmataceae bacterium]
MSDEGRTPELPVPPSAGDNPSPGSSEFRWQSFFQRSRDPLFLLDRRRRLLFVNRAWEDLTGVPADQARGLTCTRRAPTMPGPWDAVTRALAPPAEVFEGKPARARRLIAGPGSGRPARRTTMAQETAGMAAPPGERPWEPGCRSWDIDFFPLVDEHGLLGILGRVSPVEPAPVWGDLSLTAALLALHQQAQKEKAKAGSDEQLWEPDVLVALRQRMAQRHRLDQLGSDLPALRQIADQVRLVSQVLVPVLIVGEPGTGKEWLARTIHHHGVAAERPFAVLDCAHLPPEALAAVLFGEGRAPQPHFGTLYLREPAFLPRDLQARLCDRLTTGEGQAQAGPRLIAGSSADLAEHVRAGRLVEELSCMLSTVVLRLPPLRERRADLPWLVERMLERAAAEGRRITVLAPEAWELVRAYSWPGNLRELYEVLAGACARATGERIEAADLPFYLRRAIHLEQTPGPEPAGALPLDRLLAEAERRLIQLALERTGGHKARAADLLAIPRPRLFRRMKALGLAAGDESADETEVQIEPEE